MPKNTQIQFEGFRDDLEDYFKLSGIRECKKLVHHPFIVIEKEKVSIVNNPKNLLEGFADDVDVIGQWEGKWQSDFFYFKVGQFRKYIQENPAKPWHVV